MTNIQLEIVPVTFHIDYGLEIIEGREKTMVNKYKGTLYLDLAAFANALEIPLTKLEEVISYNTVVKSQLALYRNEHDRVVKVLDITGLDSLLRSLMDFGCNTDLLKTIRDQVNKLIQQTKEV